MAARNRASTSAAVRPAMRITLLRLVWPPTMVTEARGTFKNSAKNSTQAWLALPSTGGAVSDSFNAWPKMPVIAFLRARGWTLTAKVTPAGVSRTAITDSFHHRGTRNSDGYSHYAIKKPTSDLTYLLPFQRSSNGGGGGEN